MRYLFVVFMAICAWPLLGQTDKQLEQQLRGKTKEELQKIVADYQANRIKNSEATMPELVDLDNLVKALPAMTSAEVNNAMPQVKTYPRAAAKTKLSNRANAAQSLSMFLNKASAKQGQSQKIKDLLDDIQEEISAIQTSAEDWAKYADNKNADMNRVNNTIGILEQNSQTTVTKARSRVAELRTSCGDCSPE